MNSLYTQYYKATEHATDCTEDAATFSHQISKILNLSTMNFHLTTFFASQILYSTFYMYTYKTRFRVSYLHNKA